MKDKINQQVEKTKKRAKNAEDILNAASISATTIFSGFMAFQNRGKIAFILLGVASAWAVFQAFKAWTKVLDK